MTTKMNLNLLRKINCSSFNNKNIKNTAYFMIHPITLKKDYNNHYYKYERNIPKNRKSNSTILAGLLISSGIIYYKKDQLIAYAKESNLTDYGPVCVRPGIVRPELPYYKRSDVSSHDGQKGGPIWVTYRHGVYDITNFISKHPGGNKILIAAGGALEPFWALYAVHQNQEIFEMLEEFRIGNLSEEEAKDGESNLEDPYSFDPKRHSALKPASKKPFNAEPPLEILADNFITPTELFYVRNHLPVPEIDANEYRLEICGRGVPNGSIEISLEQLKKLPKHTLNATIMCAGNRRSEMTKVKPVKGLSWGAAAVGNATWTGVRLTDVLRMYGCKHDPSVRHVHFEGLDLDATGVSYGASIPAEKAFDEKNDVMFVYEMNGEPLSRDHGYPIRALVPGTVGARNVKWLGKVILSSEESQSHWQQNDYKGFSPSVDWDTVDFTKSPAIQTLPVTSAICSPTNNENVQLVNGKVSLKGYAWSGGGAGIVRVDVTIDQGETWHVAELEFCDKMPLPGRHWAWTLWTAEIAVPKEKKEIEIWCKAVDSNYNTQPEDFKNIWNLRGVLSNAYHKIRVNISH